MSNGYTPELAQSDDAWLSFTNTGETDDRGEDWQGYEAWLDEHYDQEEYEREMDEWYQEMKARGECV